MRSEYFDTTPIDRRSSNGLMPFLLVALRLILLLFVASLWTLRRRTRALLLPPRAAWNSRRDPARRHGRGLPDRSAGGADRDHSYRSRWKMPDRATVNGIEIVRMQGVSAYVVRGQRGAAITN
jgi:hypothetical protein